MCSIIGAGFVGGLFHLAIVFLCSLAPLWLLWCRLPMIQRPQHPDMSVHHRTAALRSFRQNEHSSLPMRLCLLRFGNARICSAASLKVRMPGTGYSNSRSQGIRRTHPRRAAGGGLGSLLGRLSPRPRGTEPSSGPVQVLHQQPDNLLVPLLTEGNGDRVRFCHHRNMRAFDYENTKTPISKPAAKAQRPNVQAETMRTSPRRSSCAGISCVPSVIAAAPLRWPLVTGRMPRPWFSSR